MIDNFIQRWSAGFRYVVLTRKGALKVLMAPTTAELQRCVQQGWDFLKAIDYRSDAWQVLQETLGSAIPRGEEGSADDLAGSVQGELDVGCDGDAP